MSRIQLLSFDLDDTLWPCEPTIIAAEKKLYCFLQSQVPKITQSLTVEQLRKKRIIFLEQHPEFESDLSALRIASLKALAIEFDIDDAWVSEAFQVYFDARQSITLYEDVKVTLDALQNDYRLVALSNGNADIHKTGVAHWFEFSVSAADVGFLKPHPAVFESMLSRSNCTGNQVLHIGDDPYHDVFGANQAGIRSVWLNRSAQQWQHPDCTADFHIASLTELPSLLDDLKAQ